MIGGDKLYRINGKMYPEFSSIDYKREYDNRSDYKIDKDEADFCLNCTKEKCNGNCKDYYEYMRNKKKNG